MPDAPSATHVVEPRDQAPEAVLVGPGRPVRCRERADRAERVDVPPDRVPHPVRLCAAHAPTLGATGRAGVVACVRPASTPVVRLRPCRLALAAARRFRAVGG